MTDSMVAKCIFSIYIHNLFNQTFSKFLKYIQVSVPTLPPESFYLVCGDLTISQLFFVICSLNSSHVTVLSYKINRVYRVGAILSNFLSYKLEFQHKIFDDIIIEGEHLYCYSSRCTLEICDLNYTDIISKINISNLPFLRYILLRFFRKNYSKHLAIVRQVLAFSVLNKTLYPNFKLLLRCDDKFFLKRFSHYKSLEEAIVICNLNTGILRLIPNYLFRITALIFAYFVTLFYKSTRFSFGKRSSHQELVVFKSTDSPFDDKNSRSISNYNILNSFDLSQCYHFKSGHLFSLSSTYNCNSSSIKIISLISLFGSNTFIRSYFHFVIQIFQLPIELLSKVSFLNCFTYDFFNAALLHSFLSSELKIAHYFTDNNVFSDALILYKLITSSQYIDIIQLQYSCLACPNPVMVSSADSVALFEKKFRTSFVYNNFGPKNVIPTDYIFDLSSSCRATSSQLSTAFTSFVSPFDPHSYDLVIGYLDESIQTNDCWAGVSFEKAYNDFQMLCEFVLRYNCMALVCKPQFKLNAPSNIFSSMPVLHQLIEKKCYYELGDNSLNVHQRNNLLPSVALKDVDICIGHAIGGTASYECSLTQLRSVLIDAKFVNSPLLSIPTGIQVTFSSLADVLHLLSNFPNRSLLSKTSIGIW